MSPVQFEEGRKPLRPILAVHPSLRLEAIITSHVTKYDRDIII